MLLRLGVEVILEVGLRRAVQGAAVGSLLISLDGKLSQVLASYVETGHRPRFESMGQIATMQKRHNFLPGFVDIGPWRLREM